MLKGAAYRPIDVKLMDPIPFGCKENPKNANKLQINLNGMETTLEKRSSSNKPQVSFTVTHLNSLQKL